MTRGAPGPGRPAPQLAGLVLAAGAGRRMGTPKALLRDATGTPRTVVAARDLLAAGCEEALVVLGAAAPEAARLLADHSSAGARISVVHAAAWEQGMGLSLQAGLASLMSAPASVCGVLVTLVDLPDVGAAVHRRVAAEWTAAGARSDALLRATYAGRPGHPVLLGRRHWEPLCAEVAGDTGAQRYLQRHTVREVSCDDLATGRDVDRPEDLAVDPDPGDGERR